MAHSRGLDSDAVRLAYLLNMGDASATARQFGVSRQTIHHHLRAASPLTVSRVTLSDLDPTKPEAQALAAYVRACLTRAGILKEPPASPHTED